MRYPEKREKPTFRLRIGAQKSEKFLGANPLEIVLKSAPEWIFNKSRAIALLQIDPRLRHARPLQPASPYLGVRQKEV